MNYKILSLKDKNDWKVLIGKLPISQQDIYFSPEYYSLYQNNGDGKALCFVYEKDKDIAIYPFLLNSINNLGYDLAQEYFDIQGAYGYNGAITSSYDHDFIESFYQAFDSYCERENIVSEFTRFHPIIKNHLFSHEHINTIYDRKTVFFDLSKSLDEIFAGFQRSTKKQIKRCANRYDIKVLLKQKDISILDDFLTIYSDAMERVQAIKYLRFNKLYFKELFSQSNVLVLFAIYNGKPIASISTLIGENFMHGHLGGALTEHLDLYAYSFLFWEMIKLAKGRGLKFLHVGGGATSSETDKLYEFKRHFSDDVADFFIGKKVHNETIYTEIIKQWQEKHPTSFEQNKKMILGYREIYDT